MSAAPRSDVAVVQPTAGDAGALMAIISKAASDSTYDVSKLQALLAVKKEWEANEARKAFVVALNAFKASPPEVLKSTKVSFGTTKYNHASLESASEIIGAALSDHAISHRWNVEQADGKIKVTCILTHALGHSEQVTMEATPDTSGSKNSIQAIGSAVSYLQRYTLFTASGIAPKNADDDGRGGNTTHTMDDRVKADFFEQIGKSADLKALEALWASIAAEATKSGDIPAYDDLKAATVAKRKSLKAAPI